ncbi:MAG TPA: hypothetical protein VMX13_15810 [Sedimentisphaerales bacterium]|nr:hypothetical protein [Sedimentisphaerales bacterium]
MPGVSTETYPTLEVGLVGFECRNVTHVLLELIPDRGNLVATILQVDPQQYRDLKDRLKQRCIPLGILKSAVRGWFGLKRLKRSYEWLYVPIKYADRANCSDVELVEYGMECFAFVFDEHVSPVPSVLSDAFSNGGWWNYGKRWISWTAATLKATGCKYLAAPDFESPSLTVITHLHELDTLRDIVERILNKESEP